MGLRKAIKMDEISGYMPIRLMKYHDVHWINDEYKPDGGTCGFTGGTIIWQSGLDSQNKPNGAYIEPVIYSVIRRLEALQKTTQVDRANEKTLAYLRLALESQMDRQVDRENRGVLNKYEK